MKTSRNLFYYEFYTFTAWNEYKTHYAVGLSNYVCVIMFIHVMFEFEKSYLALYSVAIYLHIDGPKFISIDIARLNIIMCVRGFGKWPTLLSV